jgi:hypothetical protein
VWEILLYRVANPMTGWCVGWQRYLGNTVWATATVYETLSGQCYVRAAVLHSPIKIASETNNLHYRSA